MLKNKLTVFCLSYAQTQLNVAMNKVYSLVIRSRMEMHDKEPYYRKKSTLSTDVERNLIKNLDSHPGQQFCPVLYLLISL